DALYCARQRLLLRVAELLDELSTQPAHYFSEVDRPHQVTQLGHLQPRIATGIDALEGFEIHVDVERQAMEGTAVANAQTQGSDLCAIDVDARRIGFGRSLDTIAGEQVDQAVLDTIDQFPHTEAQSPHVEQQIAD